LNFVQSRGNVLNIFIWVLSFLIKVIKLGNLHCLFLNAIEDLDGKRQSVGFSLPNSLRESLLQVNKRSVVCFSLVVDRVIVVIWIDSIIKHAIIVSFYGIDVYQIVFVIVHVIGKVS